MLSVIVDARRDLAKLPALLGQLTAGAVDGIVREVLIVAAPGEPAVEALCEEMGARPAPSLAQAGRAAKSDPVLVLPAGLRLRDGWIGALNQHMAAGGAPALVVGLGEGGLFRARPRGVLVERGRLDGAELDRLRRDLRLRSRRRIG